jgi:hypothetical protein
MCIDLVPFSAALHNIDPIDGDIVAHSCQHLRDEGIDEFFDSFAELIGFRRVGNGREVQVEFAARGCAELGCEEGEIGW